MAKLFLKSTRVGSPVADEVIYDEHADYLIKIYFLDNDTWDVAANQNAFSASPELGKFDKSTATVQVYGPDGPQIFLQNETGGTWAEGVFADDPIQIRPDRPGRWLIRLKVQPYEWDEANQVIVTSSEVSTFTALYEVQDPNILGHHAARAYANGSITQGTSPLGPNETSEYDSDEGWARGAERYFTTISKQMGFRKLLSGKNTGLVALTAGKAVTLTQDCLEQWKNCVVDAQEYNNFVVEFEGISAQDAIIEGAPVFILLHDCNMGDRSYAVTEGLLPYNTSGLNVGDRIYISNTGEITTDDAAVSAGGGLVRHVGHVISVDTADAQNPGVVYFHGHTKFFPGVVHGPAASTDEHLVRWDGDTGDQVKDSIVSLKEIDPGTGDEATFQTPGGEPIHLLSGASALQGLRIEAGTPPGSGNPNDVTMVGVNVDPAIGCQGLLHIEGAQGSNDQPMLVLSEGAAKRWQLEADFNAGSESVHVSSPNTNQTTIMTWETEDDGQVGIGQYQPQTKLHITQGATNPTVLRIENTSANHGGSIDGAAIEIKTKQPVQGANDLPGGIRFTNTGGDSVGSAIRHYHSHPGGGTPHDDDTLKVIMYDGLNPQTPFDTVRVKIKKVGVGNVTGDPQEALHVFGNAKVDLGITALMDIQSLGGNLMGIGAILTNGVICGGNSSVFGGAVASPGKVATFLGDIDVTGNIDPTGVIFTETDKANVPTGAGKGAIYVSDGTDGNTQGRMYYIDSTGAVTSELGAAGTLTGPGPGANSSINNGIAYFDVTTGDSIDSSRLLLNQLGTSSIVTSPSPFVAGTDSDPLILATSSVDPMGGDNSGDLILMTGSTDTGKSGDILLRGGDTGASGGGAGTSSRVYIDGGGSSEKTSPGGDVLITGGKNVEELANPNPSKGGEVFISGGEGAISGGVTLQGGPIPPLGEGYGGSVTLLGADAGVFPFPGAGNPPAAEGGQGGDINLVAGSGSENGGMLTAGFPAQGGSGGNIRISAGIGYGDSASGNILLQAGDGKPNEGPVVADPMNGMGASLPGGIDIRAGSGMEKMVGPKATEIPGGSINIQAGDAAPFSTGNGGDLYISGGEPNGAWNAGAVPADGEGGGVIINPGVPAGGYVFGQQIGRYAAFGGPSPAFCVATLKYPHTTVWGDLNVTGVVDPTGVLIKKTAQNPAITAKIEAHTYWEERFGSVAAGYAALATAIAEDPESFGFPPGTSFTPEELMEQQDNNAAQMLWMNEAGDLSLGSAVIGNADPNPPPKVVTLQADSSAAEDVDGVSGNHYYVLDLLGTEYINVDNTGGTIVINLPNPNTMPVEYPATGYTVTVKDCTGQAGSSTGIYVRPPQGVLLDGFSYENPYMISIPWEAPKLYSDGTNWFIG
jgi:hypothetical protein